MKKINVFGLAFGFIGGFLGAGFVSGRELWQFFGSFGGSGIIGAAIAVALLGVFGYMAQSLAHGIGTDKSEEIAVAFKGGIAKKIFSFFEILFVFCIYVVMLAGAGSMFKEIFGVSPIVTSIIFAALVSLVVAFGVNGIVHVFSVTVPLLVLFSLIISVLTFAKGGAQSISLEAAPVTNPLMSNPFISAFVFVSYNFFAAVSIIASLGKRTEKVKYIKGGILLGTVFLFIISASIILSMLMTPNAAEKEIPMLVVAQKLGNVFYYGFAVLMGVGMFGSSTVSEFAICSYFKSRFGSTKKVTLLTVLIASVLAVAGSTLGFSTLINTVYPAFGYLGMFALVMLTVNFIKLKKKKLPH